MTRHLHKIITPFFSTPLLFPLSSRRATPSAFTAPDPPPQVPADASPSRGKYGLRNDYLDFQLGLRPTNFTPPQNTTKTSAMSRPHPSAMPRRRGTRAHLHSRIGIKYQHEIMQKKMLMKKLPQEGRKKNVEECARVVPRPGDLPPLTLWHACILKRLFFTYFNSSAIKIKTNSKGRWFDICICSTLRRNVNDRTRGNGEGRPALKGNGAAVILRGEGACNKAASTHRIRHQRRICRVQMIEDTTSPHRPLARRTLSGKMRKVRRHAKQAASVAGRRVSAPND